MKNINPIFIEIMNEKFTDQFTVETDENCSFIRFPAKNPDFGDVKIVEEEPGFYTVWLGKFTHQHFDWYEGNMDETNKETAEGIFDFLEKLFDDSIICYGSHKGGGWG